MKDSRRIAIPPESRTIEIPDLYQCTWPYDLRQLIAQARAAGHLIHETRNELSLSTTYTITPPFG